VGRRASERLSDILQLLDKHVGRVERVELVLDSNAQPSEERHETIQPKRVRQAEKFVET
jgi:hypothetical protein